MVVVASEGNGCSKHRPQMWFIFTSIEIAAVKADAWNPLNVPVFGTSRGSIFVRVLDGLDVSGQCNQP
jgi:hypothetical protein